MLKLTRGNIIIISISIIFLFCYFYYKYRTVRLPSCYLGGGWGEWNERETAYKWTFPDACVLEFGGGAVDGVVFVSPVDVVFVSPVNEDIMDLLVCF